MQLRIESTTGSRVVALESGAPPLIAGRDAAAAIHLPDPDRLLSRQHLSFRAEGAGVEMRVVSSSSGAFTNHGPVTPGQTTLLMPGDHVNLGPYTLTVEDDAAMAAPSAIAAPGISALLAAGFSGTPQSHAPAPMAAGGAGHDGYWVGQPKPPKHKTFSGEEAVGPGHATGGLDGFGPQVPEVPGADAVNAFLGSPSALPAPPPARPHTPPPAPMGPVLVLPDYQERVDPPLAIERPAPAAPQDDAPGFDWSKLSQALADKKGPMAPAPTPAPAPPTEAPPDPSTAWPKPPLPPAPAAQADPQVLPPVAEPSGPPSEALQIDVLDLIDGGVGASSLAAPVTVVERDAPAVPAASAPAPSVSVEPVALTPQRGGMAPEPPAEPAPQRSAGDADLPAHAFARGLGIPAPQDIGSAEWERIGNAVRCMVESFGQLMAARAALKSELRASNKTELWLRDNNPFKSQLSESARLQQLLFAEETPGGAYMGTERAVREAAEDLLTHNLAILAASRACVEGIVKDFDPEHLKSRLTTDKKGLIALTEQARLWRAYTEHYNKRSAHMADWLERLFDEHFVTAYARESERLSQQHIPLP